MGSYWNHLITRANVFLSSANVEIGSTESTAENAERIKNLLEEHCDDSEELMILCVNLHHYINSEA